MKAGIWWFKLQRELGNWRLWLTRALVVVFAALAGFSIVVFSWLGDWAFERFSELRSHWSWAPLIWTPLCTVVIVALTRRFWPGAAGSGIPQVMAALDPKVAPQQRGLFVSLRLSLAKVGLTSCGLLGGLSLGREGPSVQVAAGVMHAARHWLPERTAVSPHGLLVAGGAAGIAAAFNTPLGGVMFAIEELSGRPEHRSSGLLIAGIVLAGLVAASINGNGTYFGVIHVQGLDLSLLWPGLLLAVGCGLLGGVFSRLMISSLRGEGADVWSRWRRARPLGFAAACGLAVALIGLVTDAATFGGGYGYTQSLLQGARVADWLYAPLKLLATWLTAWSGVPAGIFAPSLAIGAAWGSDVAGLLGISQTSALIALGMVGFLAATTQAPLTAFIIVMEMVDGHAMVLSLMACALIASGLSRLISPPLYRALTQLQLARLPLSAEVAEATEPAGPQAAASAGKPSSTASNS